MKKNLLISIWMTLVTTVLLGLIYPLVVTGIAQVLFPRQANGSLIEENGKIVGSRLIGQLFSSRGYFISRPSGAGTGYDPMNSGSGFLAPTNKELSDRVSASVKQLRPENPSTPIPVDLVTQSASGLDPDISPAAAEFQILRIAHERGMSETEIRALVAQHTQRRTFGFLGEPRVNVLELNLDLDRLHALH